MHLCHITEAAAGAPRHQAAVGCRQLLLRRLVMLGLLLLLNRCSG